MGAIVAGMSGKCVGHLLLPGERGRNLKLLTKLLMRSTEITDLSADELSLAIHAKRVSCREVMQAYLARIHRLNPTLNAIVNLAPDDTLLAQAGACDAELARGVSRGWLHGIPQAIKDTGNALGFPTTFGCTLLKNALPKQDSVMTARMKSAGCIVIGKTNMPEL
ncbi:MAG TPA: amidase family protein, partial [Casimicrobium sp.]|nr:amidase family protein [Casimicrobium sp.]